jgi:UTP--glucose-1-phosphate uridylyltransferase
MKKVTKLVLPVAGLGKRLLPLTKHTPKNLVPVNGKPMIEYVLEDAVVSGIRDVILVIGPKHRTHFASYIKKSQKKFPTLTFHVRIQETPGGNGHAIAQAYDLIGDEPFAVRFCDDVLVGNPPVLKCLIDIFDRYQSSILLLERVPMKMVFRFGVVGLKKVKKGKKVDFFGGAIHEITKIVEKPNVKDAPSNLTIVGGYILTADIVRNLRIVADTLPIVADDALPLAVALQIDLILKNKIYGWEFPSRRLDCGTLEKLREAEAFLLAQGRKG